MPIYAIDDLTPEFDDPQSVWIAPTASVVGNIHIGADVGIWFGAAIRGDNEPIRIGAGSNIQENAVLHVDPGQPLTMGQNCTIGHGAIVHGCTLGNQVLVGMGATVLNGAVIGDNCLIGANALVTEGKAFPEGSLIMGAPAKAVKVLSADQLAGLKRSAENYVARAKQFKAGMKEV